jgi:hypothetical protein
VNQLNLKIVPIHGNSSEDVISYAEKHQLCIVQDMIANLDVVRRKIAAAFADRIRSGARQEPGDEMFDPKTMRVIKKKIRAG